MNAAFIRSVAFRVLGFIGLLSRFPKARRASIASSADDSASSLRDASPRTLSWGGEGRGEGGRFTRSSPDAPPYFGVPLAFFQPGPRTTRPGLAPVWSPSFNTCVPLTNTCTTPAAYCCGFSNVA